MAFLIAPPERASLMVASRAPHLQRHAAFNRPLHSRVSAPLRASASPDESSELNSSAEEMVQQLLSSDPEALERAQRVASAAERVAELQMEQARLARAISESQGSQEEQQALAEKRAEESASALMAEAEVKAAALRLRAAELEAETASSMRQSAEATAALEAERLETGKAGAAGAVGGLACALPAALTEPSTLGALLALGGAGASAFLFGLVYRYALRTDATNLQLKGGVVAAFGLVRGIAAASALLSAGTSRLTELPSVEVVGTAAAALGQSMLLFGFASASLEFAFQRGWVRPFSGGAE